MCLPSGLQTGLRFRPGGKVKRDGLSNSKSYTQTLAFPPSDTLAAKRLPSGEKRGGPEYSAEGARRASVWPLLSSQTSVCPAERHDLLLGKWARVQAESTIRTAARVGDVGPIR
jgi:hypothetical protein